MRDTRAVLFDLIRELHIEARLAGEQGIACNERAQTLRALDKIEPLTQAREHFGRGNGLLHAAERLREALAAG